MAGMSLAGARYKSTTDFLARASSPAEEAPALSVVNRILDFSSGTWQNCGAISATVSGASLVIVPPGFNPASLFASYSSTAIVHTVGTTLTVAAGQQVMGTGTINDPVNCQGTIRRPRGSST